MEQVAWFLGSAVWFGLLIWGYRRLSRWFWRRRGLQEQARCPEGKGLYPECLWVVTLTDDEIGVRQPDGSASTLSLADLTTVTIETNDSGPGGADVWWCWQAGPSTISYPQGATGEARAFTLLRKLQGYDGQAVSNAMGCTSNQTFVVYAVRSDLS
jgi:hypothetical protein